MNKDKYRLRRKPPLYESPDELLDYFYQYVLNCIDKERMPTHSGMTVHCFANRTNKHRYEHKEDYCNAFEQIYDVLEDETVNSKHIDGTTKKAVLQTKFNYLDKISNTNDNRNTSESFTEEQEERLKQLIDKLNSK